MTREELFSLEDGTYLMHLSDLDGYLYYMTVKTNENYIAEDGFYKWVTIVSDNPETIHSKVTASQRTKENGYILFSTESVFGLHISTTSDPSWLEYLTHLLDKEGNKRLKK